MSVASSAANAANIAAAASVASGWILPLQPESDLTKRLGSLFFSRLIRRILALCQVQRPREQRVDANLADERSEHDSEVVVGATGRRGHGRRISAGTGAARDHAHDSLLQYAVFRRRHTESARALREPKPCEDRTIHGSNGSMESICNDSRSGVNSRSKTERLPIIVAG